VRERLIFRHFFAVLAIGGALAEWGLACWLLAPFGVAPPAALHLTVPSLLAAVNLLAARRLVHEQVRGPLTGRAGHVLLAMAFGALVCGGVLGVMAGGWAALRLFGALRAEAGIAAVDATEALFAGGFRPLASVVLALTAGTLAYGYVHGHRRLVVTRLALPLEGLPPALAGLRVVQVSDLHLGPLAHREALRDAFARVAALDPDIVCVTGDLVDSPATDLDSWMPELARLSARHGVFAILGNHDRQVGAERVAAALGRWTAWRILRDEVATIEVGGARLHLLGLEDRPEGSAAEALPALLATVPGGEPAILLAHRPSVFPAAAAAGVRLILAGHTHGGQLAVPGVRGANVARLVVTRFDAGSFERDGALLHVNRGLGTSGQRVRVGAPREITLFTLVPPAARAA